MGASARRGRHPAAKMLNGGRAKHLHPTPLRIPCPDLKGLAREGAAMICAHDWSSEIKRLDALQLLNRVRLAELYGPPYDPRVWLRALRFEIERDVRLAKALAAFRL